MCTLQPRIHVNTCTLHTTNAHQKLWMHTQTAPQHTRSANTVCMCRHCRHTRCAAQRGMHACLTVYAHMHTAVHTCTPLHTQLGAHMHSCMHSYVQLHIVHTPVHRCNCTHSCKQAETHQHMQSQMQQHVHTPKALHTLSAACTHAYCGCLRLEAVGVQAPAQASPPKAGCPRSLSS